MFQAASNLKTLRDALSSHMELSDYFLGMHAFFDGEVIFARDVVQVNTDFPPFPVDFDNVWKWFRDQIKGPPIQETLAYETTFGVDDEADPVMERLIEITEGSANTIWLIDLANQDGQGDGRRFVIVTSPDKRQAGKFLEEFHGYDSNSL
ncbi:MULTISPECIES: hypothetical protein [unclassified Rhizobium]|jgi:hypothetical protein|uniref:hypothetical protein n=1 Tax=Rhizobium sp. BG4 TaxID=2613770 RepID=UPI0010F1F33E|nr:hypothetical protein [Rhizobium sp. BG4]